VRKEEDIRQQLQKEIDAFLSCPKFAVEEHAHNIHCLAWVLGMSDDQVDDLIREAENRALF
jgi:hypothetical protein